MSGILSGKINFLSRKVKTRVLRFLHPLPCDTIIADLKNSNIILKNRSSWTRTNILKVKELVDSMAEKGVVKELKAEKLRISVTKEYDVKIESVISAINEATRIIRGQSILLPFQKSKMKMGKIDLLISSKQEIPIYIPKKGTMIFGAKYLSKSDEMLGLDKTKEEGIEGVNRIIAKHQLPESDYRSSHTTHVNEVINAYYQIGAIFYDKGLLFDQEEIKEQKGFLRLFNRRVSAGRVRRNIKFLKSMYLNTSYKVIIPTIVYHDVGKMKPGGEDYHPEVSATLLDKEDFLGLGHIDWLILENSILYHGVPGGIHLGEYSMMSIYHMFEDKEISEIIAAGRINEYIDNLTLLTACDIAGQKRYIPLNRNIEDLVEFNMNLKSILNKIIKKDEASGEYRVDSEGDARFFKCMMESTINTSEIRLCKYLSCQDENLDVNTNLGYNLYRNKLRATFKTMGISTQEQSKILKLFALLKSFPYSSVPIYRALWNVQEDVETAKILSEKEISQDAVRFLIYVAEFFSDHVADELREKIESDKDYIIIANFLNESNNSIRDVNKNKESIQKFVKMVNEDKLFPELPYSAKGKHIKMDISLTKPATESAKQENKSPI